MGSTKVLKKVGLKVEDILSDYRLAVESREASIIGRKEVFMGKAKFGIFGDGKELAQIAMAKVFRNGDFRSGYYRDQTFMMAIDGLTVQEYFAQLYAHMSVEAEPASGGRMMNGHFANRLLDENGKWKKQTEMKNSSSDISPTAAQMPRLVGLAYASKLYRQNTDLHDQTDFSIKGNEVAFGTIGNASTSEGHFFEAINAAGVLQVPMVISVWDDDYGISVPKEYHTTGGSISEFLVGIQRAKDKLGYEIIKVKGWDYDALVAAYQKAEKVAREEHVPVFVHVNEITQPQGHSTSGSHERYKSKERLEWEKDHDCNVKFKEWILENELASEEELTKLEKEAKASAKAARAAAWEAFISEIKQEQKQATDILDALAEESAQGAAIIQLVAELKKTVNPIRLETTRVVKKVLRLTRNEETSARASLVAWLEKSEALNEERYSSLVMSESDEASIKVAEIKAKYSENSPLVDGREVLQACFDAALSRDPRVFAIGEDVGKIGDVNQAFAGLQDKYGELRVTDTGIRETTIIGQGIGAALRGLRPITEIQYLDYLLYAIQTLSDDLATLQYRTAGGQKAPLIIRTRGHRLEGVWHSGSPISMILGSLRGINVLVPRDMTQAAGFYNTMLKSDDPALIIECLNGYRLKERIPDNIGEFTVPLGVPEVLREGTDVTVVTYGSMCRVVMQAAEELEEIGVSVEVIDVQSLLPFDVDKKIVESLKKTNRVIFADEDVPGGASAYMMQKVVEEQGGYFHLDSQPVTISAKEHRPAYASDGDYWSKPNVETVFDKVYALMEEVDPQRFPKLY
ncbi:pyruvate/2-oxoglutarate/acetoin dehydrogenase E1 component [Roseivirga pacifica]|uniref:Pyruvate/2-oxoglutarate/acetoin dehydrogenase complex, dehydrogenase (E1) component n=1 Tax=Roseivirga pacifica TaxID=1267423 RepID=A0A1I0RFZ4_9BACT|nr:alpha-ketoacid dehydrogenase subunit alpha/beta [Roseivirga pacifica]RKQ49564.1 pyruvate/2-oxoglutarate/acetoin dehydrogenase E1 component [Roseivirga pacifica]SEW39838.1 Pyruvate/2-oxoglutarate/acetoin dehydrogenase complex, dehydrogenase (E1) component [Roseivirga pacifica]